jgi:outer membrane receptor protein involved in Fe transport
MNTISAAARLLSVSTYLRRIRDVTQSRLFQQDGVWVEAPFNDGNARAHGVELEAKLPLTKALDLRANLSRNWSRVDNVPGPDNRLEEQTPATANIGADYRWGQWTLGGNLNYQAGGRHASRWNCSPASAPNVSWTCTRRGR